MNAIREKVPLVTVITPVFNGGDMLKPTIESVIGQTYASIEYIIVDGGSSDNTIDVVELFGDNVTVFISEPDAGMYDALAKGLSKASGEVICYINAGDYLYPHAVQLAVDLFESKNISWLTGCRSVCNEKGQVTHIDLPFRYKRSLIRSGSYGKWLPFIQQESTFWRSSLLGCIDVDFLRGLKLAGDYYLWWCFSKEVDLNVVSSPLGVFKKHAGQLSEASDAYFSELDKFVDRRGMVVRLQEIYELFFWALHPKIRALFYETAFRYDHQKRTWVKKYK
mgnify:CR=1 FL=1